MHRTICLSGEIHTDWRQQTSWELAFNRLHVSFNTRINS